MNDKTRIRLAVTGIVLMGAMLITSASFTIAWYNGSAHLAVSNFDISVADKNLSVSVDNENFSDELLYADIKDAIPEKYSPVSSAFSNEWLDKKSEAPQFTEGYNEPNSLSMTSIDKVALATDGYFQKELYIKCDTRTKVTLDTEKTFVNADKEKNVTVAKKLYKWNQKNNNDTPYKDMSEAEIASKLNRIEDSLRFSILILNDTGSDVKDEEYQYTIFDPHKNGTTQLGGILDTDSNGYYDSLNGKEVIYGEVENANIDTLSYRDANIVDEGVNKVDNCFVAAHEKNVQPLDMASSISKGMSIKEEKALSLAEAKEFSFSLQAEISKKIVLSLYIEGWDRDSVNYTMFSCFVTSLGFKIYDNGNGGN